MLMLADAVIIIDAALREARAKNLAPLAVAVLDPGGHLIAYQREDGAGIVRFDIAFSKAFGSLGMGFGSRELSRRAGNMPTFFTMLSATTGGRLVASPGGVLVLGPDRQVLGAVGISGDLGDNDEACAIAGIAAAGFRTEEPPGA
ncbi:MULTISPECIES: GlcG/HbpS family heme-binding protein [unclassified Bradyrhizobium]|uniref:GlcG/HbpS family heme-binding protein n=1 Tax=unclassified Bradyrhizobium TaxID=2631580 RepID=UPI0028EA1854|nr:MULTISPECIES: heme-binding protein [unclassified Bradyrhizobium]